MPGNRQGTVNNNTKKKKKNRAPYVEGEILLIMIDQG